MKTEKSSKKKEAPIAPEVVEAHATLMGICKAFKVPVVRRKNFYSGGAAEIVQGKTERIILNAGMPMDRELVTLAHEIGHMLDYTVVPSVANEYKWYKTVGRLERERKAWVIAERLLSNCFPAIAKKFEAVKKHGLKSYEKGHDEVGKIFPGMKKSAKALIAQLKREGIEVVNKGHGIAGQTPGFSILLGDKRGLNRLPAYFDDYPITYLMVRVVTPKKKVKKIVKKPVKKTTNHPAKKKVTKRPVRKAKKA